MLPTRLAKLVNPPPHCLLVVRDAAPEKINEIVVPFGYRDFTRTTTATVVKVGHLVDGFLPGDRLLLAASVGKCMTFGPLEDVEVWRVLPAQVMLKLKATDKAEHLGEHPLRNFQGDKKLIESRIIFEEGDPRGPR